MAKAKREIMGVPAPKKGKTWVSRTIAWIHLWPSLISGLILLFVCLTGTIVVYCDEIMEWHAGEARYVKRVGVERLPVEDLINRLKEEFPDRRTPAYMVGYKDPRRSVRFNTFSKDKGLRMVYVDPYSGEILKDDGTIYFFYITAHLHNSLLLGKTGKWIVDVATIIFLIELITGLVLWWPAKWTKSTRDASFKVKWKAKFKRLNYDLHNVIGFYSLSVALVLTLTGLIIAYPSISSGLITALGGDASHSWEGKLPGAEEKKAPIDIHRVIQSHFARYPDTKEVQLNTFNLEKSGVYAFRLARTVGLKSADHAYPFFIDRYSGQPLTVPEGVGRHELVENMYWSLHMGTWLGPLGKLLTFIGGLVSTSLPITGFLIWWGRRRKKKKGTRPGEREQPTVRMPYKPKRTIPARG